MKKVDRALYEAGRMSNAIDKARAALNAENANDFGVACTQLLDAKFKYDREIDRRAMTDA